MNDTAPAAITETINPSTGSQEAPPKATAAPVPPTPPEPKKELQSSRFAALAKKETALVRERAALKADREKIEQERAEASKLVEAQKLALTDPIKALELLGITYKQLTEVVLNDSKPTPELREKTLEDRLRAELKKELEDRDKQLEEKQTKGQKEKEEQIRREFQDQSVTYLKANKDKFPLINHPKNDMDYTSQTISAIIEQNYYNTAQKDEHGKIVKPGVLMSVSDAAQIYENHLADLAKDFYSHIQPKSDGAPKAEDPKRQESVEEPRTITNSMSTGLASNLPAKTEADRIKRALAALSS